MKRRNTQANSSPNQSPVKATVVIVGGGYAGVMAANRVAARLRANESVVLITERDELVHRVRLHEMLAGTRTKRYPLTGLLHPKVQLVTNRVVCIDAAAARCELQTGGHVAYGQLILATGSQVEATVPGVREHAMALCSPDNAVAFADKLHDVVPRAPIAVLGGGLTAIEVACELAATHPRLSVLVIAEALAPGWPMALVSRAHRELKELGIEVRLGARVASVDARTLRLENGECIEVSGTVWAAGFRCPALVADSRLPTDALGRARVDETLRVLGFPDIVAAGDAAAPPLACVGSGITPMRMACATAMPMGAHAADVVLDQLRGRAPRRFRYRNTVQCVSIGRRRGLLVFIDQDDRPSGRLLGAAVGAFAKELICRAVIATLYLDRWLPGLFWWPGRGKRRRLVAQSGPVLPQRSES